MGDATTSEKKPLLIFDFDGTLADTLYTGVAIYNDIAPEYSLPTVTPEEVAELRKLHSRALLESLGISRMMAVKLGARIRHILHQRMDEVAMLPEAQAAIPRLREAGYPMGIITSNAADNVRTFLKKYELSDCFNFIEAGVSLFGKSRRIRKMMKQEGVEDKFAMYVGDETRDIEAAHKSGIPGIAVCWGTNERDAMLSEGANYIVETADELVAAAGDFKG